MQDRVYAAGKDQPPPFAFTDEVAAVFPDMLARSVPGYDATLRFIRTIADQVILPGSRVYDLGCSLGAVSLAVAEEVGNRAAIIAVDNAPAMIHRLREILKSTPHDIDVRHQDVREGTFENASLSVLNFTLQFLPLEDRLPLLTRIAEGTLPGGVLVVSEKIRFDDETIQQQMTQLHEAFKRRNGYSDLEISRKRTALENVLLPETIESHQTRFWQAGFTHCDVWFQCFNFVSFIATK
jgi:tRNA (cmo5U34)-methyltransferase